VLWSSHSAASFLGLPVTRHPADRDRNPANRRLLTAASRAEGKTFPDGVLILGTPGKVVRDVTDDEKSWIVRIADGYVQRARKYKTELRREELPPGAI
jgi:hypothetical protein